MGAIDIVKDQATSEKYTDPIAPAIVARAVKHGLICRAVTFDNQDTLVFAPPLITNKQEINKIIDILHQTQQEIESESIKR